MPEAWKVPHLVKGLLTRVPPLAAWRANRGEHAAPPRYCYAVWLRHLVLLAEHGFRPAGARVAELGPGASLGVGLAALLGGAVSYTGLDVVAHAARQDLVAALEALAALLARGEPIPDEREFPLLRPRLDGYAFPDGLVDRSRVAARAAAAREALVLGPGRWPALAYRAPWRLADLGPDSLDLVLSQGVLQSVDDPAGVYRAMGAWLRPGGLGSHVLDLGAAGTAPWWNGHWAYTERQWRVVRGRRPYLVNRLPLGEHLALAAQAGLEVVRVVREEAPGALPAEKLAAPFRGLDDAERRTRRATVVLRRPA